MNSASPEPVISMTSTLILRRVDPRRPNFLIEYSDEKCEKYLDLRRELAGEKRRGCREVFAEKAERWRA
jgi:hypothetical protein